MDIKVGIGVVLFILYWWLLSLLIDVILEKPKLKNAYWLIVGAVNALIIFSVHAICSNAILSYLIMAILIFAEFAIFYKDRLSGYLLCTVSCSMHIIAVFIMVISCFAKITGYSPYEILANENQVGLCIVISFAILDLAILAVIKFVPLLQVRLISQHKEQRYFIIAWAVINNITLVYSATTFYNPNFVSHVAIGQAVNALTALTGMYIVLFFSIKTSAILGYKEKSKALEQAIQQEQQYRNSMVKDALASYEINVTKDLIVKGCETMQGELGDKANSYSYMMSSISSRLIHSDDVDAIAQSYSRENVIELFNHGQSEISVEYRRLSESGDFIWVRAITNLVEDINNGDVKAFICIKNIDAEKRNQLELQHMAERDPLTGLYNKTLTSKLVEKHLASSKGQISSALFMIDVDNFKEINDNLGHVYGDAVLCELADRLVNIFRTNDVVGRIGGDEFIVFLKDCASAKKVEEKAAEICKAFHITYKGLNGEEFTISSSIGISTFPKDGNSFGDLYGYADVALYTAKNEGKQTYKIYDGRNFIGYSSSRTEIQAIGGISQKGFRQNRIEYVFKMLYQSENSVAAIRSALELVASHFSFERGYIFETSKDGKTTSNTFEWCADGVTPEIDNLQRVPIEAVATANANFRKNGTFILRSLEDIQPIERAVLEPQGIKSMFQFGIFDKSHLLGFIGFDNCRSEAVPSATDIDEMATICNILATFFVKQHIDEVAAKDLRSRQEVMNNLDSYIYVINTATFEVLFMNDKIQKLLSQEKGNVPCYSFFRGNTEQCSDCPIHKINDGSTERVRCELYNDKLKIWMDVTASTLRWTDGSLACLMNCADITNQKEVRQRQIRQLENLAYVDDLTGCRNYHKFKEDAQFILEKQSNLTHFITKLDIDNFKLVNQIYGYEKGNEVLCCVAKAIEQTTRNENEIFARVTNDEFIVLFAVEDRLEIEALNKSFIDNFHSLVGVDIAFKFNFPNGRYIVSPSDKNNPDINDMFEKVNFAHKAAKLEKTSDFIYYDERMTKEALHVREIENKMMHALENDEFAVFLQPQYYLNDETIGGAEALTRWKQENLDLFLPNTFIPIFEQNGFITKLDFYIFTRVCNLIKGWVDAGIEPVTVSVNFSRLHLGNVNFVKQLCEIVDSVGIKREYLEIEITETVIYDNIDTLEGLLNEIHQSGFSLSMDDFGSGYSSLGMLKNLCVDVIKIDRSFFVDQRDKERSKTVVGSVIKMAAKLGISTIAEGVEEQEHIDFLRELDCDMVQGFYYARPMDTESFTKLIIEQKTRRSKVVINKQNP